MADVAAFGFPTPLRCYARRRDRPGLVCGERAIWVRPPTPGALPQYFCDAHRHPTDEPIPANPVYRRVHVNAEIIFAGVDLTIGGAEAEVLELIRLVIQKAGGQFSPLSARSLIGQHTPPSRAGVERREGQRGK